MEYEVIILLLSISFIILIIGIYLLFIDLKNKIKEQKELDRYLDTVFNRINMSSSKEALLLLLDEMNKSIDNYTYHQITYVRYLKLKSYLIGKAQVLKGKDFVIENFKI